VIMMMMYAASSRQVTVMRVCCCQDVRQLVQSLLLFLHQQNYCHWKKPGRGQWQLVQLSGSKSTWTSVEVRPVCRLYITPSLIFLKGLCHLSIEFAIPAHASSHISDLYCSNTMIDLSFLDHVFDSQSDTAVQLSLANSLCPCASVTRQYNLVLAKRVVLWL